MLVYTTAPLERPVAIAGSIRVSLHASTSAEDTDFTGKLVDLEPEGYCANLAEFRVGHRIRLEISSSNFPAYDRNLNSRVSPERGGPDDIRIVQQRISHGGVTPSSVQLPVVP